MRRGGMATSALAGAARIQAESRPRLPRSYETEHFLLYYTDDPKSPHVPSLDDGDQDGIPDYVEHLGAYLERAWSLYTGSAPDGMGYTAPPVKSGSRYPVYIYQLPLGYTGQTWPESKSGRRATSHVSIDAHLYEPYVRAVAAHEFFHAVQFGYNASANSWWKEASADWASHEVFPDVDTYLIPYYDWFQVPGRSLDYADGWHEYGGSLWARYLSEARGRDVIRAIWNSQRTENDSVQAMARALDSMGTTLAGQFREFAAWNWFTGARADAGHYKEAQLYPMLTPTERSAGTLSSLNGSLPRLASAYYSLIPSGASAPVARGLTLRLRAEAGISAQLILERKDQSHTTVSISGPRYHVAGFEQGFRRAVLIFSSSEASGRQNFSVSVGLGLIFRDQYGYVWSLEVGSSGAVSGTVDLGDDQPWPVRGTINAGAFHWRAANPDGSRSDRWDTGFDVAGSLQTRASAAANRWTNDAGRSDAWTGAVLDGPIPPATLTNRRGPALR